MSVLSVSLLIFVSDFEQHEFHQSELVAVAGGGGGYVVLVLVLRRGIILCSAKKGKNRMITSRRFFRTPSSIAASRSRGPPTCVPSNIPSIHRIHLKVSLKTLINIKLFSLHKYVHTIWQIDSSRLRWQFELKLSYLRWIQLEEYIHFSSAHIGMLVTQKR